MSFLFSTLISLFVSVLFTSKSSLVVESSFSESITAITSPTFTLANCYEGDLVINHLDVYRLTHIEETRDLGLHELIDDQSVTLIEWGDVIAGALPCGYLEIRFNLGETSEERNVHLQIFGSEWEDRIESIEAIREKMC